MREFDLRKNDDRYELVKATCELLQKQMSPVKYRDYEVTGEVIGDRYSVNITRTLHGEYSFYWFEAFMNRGDKLVGYEAAYTFDWVDLRHIYRMIGGTDGQKK